MKSFRIIMILALILSLTTFCFADVLVFKSGERKMGKVIEENTDDENVTFLTVAGRMKIPRNRIARIDNEPDDVSYLRIAEDYFKLNNYGMARDYAERSLAQNPDNEKSQRLLSEIKTAIKRELEKTRKQESMMVDRNLARAEEQINNKKFIEAENLLKEVRNSNNTEKQQQKLRELSFTLHYQWGLDSLDHLDSRGAAQHFETALSYNPDNREVFAKLVSIWEKEPKMTSKVLDIYEKQYQKNPDDMELARKLAGLYIREQKYEKALPLLVKVDKSSEYDDSILKEKLRNTLEVLHDRAASDQNWELAAEYYKKILDAFPNADPTPLYYYEYIRKLEKLDTDDLEAVIDLAYFAKDHQMEQEAKKQFRYVLRKDPEHQRALAGLSDFAREDINEARRAFRKNDFSHSVYLATNVINEYAILPNFVEQARELRERAENEIRKAQRQKSERALALARRGDEYYATANMHISALKSADRVTGGMVINDKVEARTFLKRAISAWEAALEIDPTLAARHKEDLQTKLDDAREKLRRLYTVIPIPETDRFRKDRGRND